MIRRASTAALRYSVRVALPLANADRATRLAARDRKSTGGSDALQLRALGNVYSLTEGYFGRDGTPL